MSHLGHPRRHLAVVGSTMDAAAEWAAEGAPHGAVVTTDHQTAGRGRLGRTWHDAPGHSLLASVIVRQVPADALGLLPLAVGLAVAEAIAPLTSGTVRLKWPNDVLVDGRKAAGLLTEARHGPEGPVAIVGLGVNLDRATVPADLSAQATALDTDGRAIDRDAVLVAILDALADHVDTLATAPEQIVRAFEGRMAGQGDRATLTASDGRQTTGRIVGVAADGALRLDVDGTEQTVYAGEVSLRPAPVDVLACDIGNSAVKVGRWHEGTWTVERWPTDPSRSREAWAERLAPLAAGAARGGYVSVVPAMSRVLDAAVDSLGVSGWAGHVRPETVPPEAPVIPASTLALATAGSDRFAAVAGAVSLATDSASVVVVCAGTALTVESVRRDGGRWIWLGGVIAPGPDLLRHALADHTAALPLIDWPNALPPPAGRTTPEAMQAGAAGLFAGGAEALIRRAARALPSTSLVLATGGWADWLARHTDAIDRVEPTLILDGVRALVSRPVGTR